MTQSIEKSFLIDWLNTSNAIYRDSLTFKAKKRRHCKGIQEKLGSGRMVWTLGLWKPRRLESGHLDSGRLGAWNLGDWTLGFWRLGLWTPGHLDSGWMTWILDAWTLYAWMLGLWMSWRLGSWRLYSERLYSGQLDAWTIGPRKFFPFLVISIII